MEGFKSNTKMQCFKEGGSVKYESRKEHKEEMSADVGQDKKIIKKAFKIHDAQEHKGEHTNLSKLKKGGRAKKDCGTVRKYKDGGSVTNVYEAKKSAGDKDNIAKVKGIKPGKAEAPSKAAARPNFAGSDVEKEKSKPAGHKDAYIKSKQSGKSAAAPSGAKGPDAFKKGGAIKKYEAGGSVMDSVRNAVMGTPEQNAIASQKEKAYLKAKMAQKAAGANLGTGEQMAMGLAGMGQSLQPAAQAAPAGSTVPAGQKKGGKVCR